jgi:hypothetical protein
MNEKSLGFYGTLPHLTSKISGAALPGAYD